MIEAPIVKTLSYSQKNEKTLRQKHIEDSNNQLSLLVNVEVTDDAELSEKVENICIASLEKHIINNLSKASAENQFEEALKEINLALSKLQKGKERLYVNAVLAMIYDNVLYLSQSGDAEAYLIRNHNFNIITESVKNQHNEYFINVASGEISKQDTIIFSNIRLLRFLTTSQLIAIFKENIKESLNLIKEAATMSEAKALNITLLSFATAKESALSHKAHPSFPERIFSFFSSSISSVTHFLSKKGKHMQWNKKFVFSGIIVTTILLVVTISLLNSSQIEKQQIKEMRESLHNITDELKKAENLNIQGQKTEAGNILNKLAGEVKIILNSGEFRTESIQLSEQIESQKELVNNIQKITEPTVIADLSSKRSDVDSLGIVGDGEDLYTFEYNALYEIILNVIEEQPLTISEDNAVILGTAMPDKESLYFYTRDKRIIEYKDRRFAFVDTGDPLWKNTFQLATFKRNLYFLDPAGNQIWKYSRRNADFSKAESYIQDASDITNAISFAIDGSVYVLHDDGKITEFYTGKQNDFMIDNLPPNILTGCNKIFTAANYQFIYVLDSKNNRIAVIRKPGQDIAASYKKQIILENAETIRDLYVDKVEQKLYLLGKTKVYGVNL